MADGDSWSDDYFGAEPRRSRVGMPPKSVPRTVAGLQLNVEAAEEGRLWLLLPKEYRDVDAAKAYPLPEKLPDLTRLAAIRKGPTRSTVEPGAIYLRRCRRKLLGIRANHVPGLRAERHADRVEDMAKKTVRRGQEAEIEMKQIVEGVRAKAVEATASLTDLFALMKKGLRQQMEAYTEARALNGAPVSPETFQGACRIVTRAVMGMGLPSEDVPGAREDVFAELEKARQATQTALALQKDGGEPN